MEFFENLGDKIAAKSKEVAGKAKEMAEVSGLKGRISTEEDLIKKYYLEIGRIYYEQFGENPDALFTAQCRGISESKQEIAKLEEKIKRIKEEQE